MEQKFAVKKSEINHGLGDISISLAILNSRLNKGMLLFLLSSRLDYQPLFGKGARAPPPNSRLD